MANPYDFTSGYFQSRDLAERRKQSDDIKQYRTEAIQLQKDEIAANAPYKAALARQADAGVDEAGARTAGLRSQNKINDLFFPRLEAFFNKNNPKLGAKGGSTFDPKKFASPNYGFKADYNLVDPQDPEDFDRYADGTKGGLRISRPPSALVNPAEVAQPDAMAPETMAPDRVSPLQVLSDNDPQKATSLTQNIFGASPKEFQEMLGAFSMIDFARGKATSKDLMNQVDNIRKMQAEGVGVAIQRGLAGDFKGAQSAFDESGDQRFGDNVQAMKKIKIENVVPGAAKKTKDFYDGLELTMKDGSKMTLDPRRLLAETVSLKEVVDNDYKFADSIRRNDANVLSTESANARTALDRTLRNDQLAERAEQKDRSMYQDGLKGMINREYNAWLNNRDPNLTISPEEKQKQYNRIEDLYGPNQYLGNLNISLGNKKIDPFTVKKYTPFMDPSTPGASGFWGNNNNFMTDKNGNRMEKPTAGGTIVMTKDGVYLPLPMDTGDAATEVQPRNPPPSGSNVPVVNQSPQTERTAIPPVKMKPSYGAPKFTIEGIPLKTFKTPEEAEKAWVEKQKKDAGNKLSFKD